MVESILLGVVTGLVSGVIASYVFWYLITHRMTPKIAFSDKISKQSTQNTSSGYYYQFRFENSKKKQAALDVDVRAILYCPKIMGRGTNLYDIPLDTKNILELPSLAEPKRCRRRVSFRIETEEFCDKFNKNYFPENFKKLTAERRPKLEDVFNIINGTYIRIYVSATDGYSGSKKVFKSKDYRAEDIIEGRFIDGSLDIETIDKKSEPNMANPADAKSCAAD